jgi:SAM-dependent methyltransferase
VNEVPDDGAVLGTGPVTNDGSLVEIYRQMPSTGEPERIHVLLKPNSSVLDLGAGVGRIADPLAELGHQVTAVDDSADMLAHVHRARTVRARIEELRLPEKFDAVLLVTNLINYPGTDLRRGMLATVAQHLKPTGKGIIQWRPPQWFASRPEGCSYRRTFGPLLTTMTIHTNRDGLADAEFTLESDGYVWRQPLHLECLTDAALRCEFDRVGLKLDTSAPEETEWLELSPSPDRARQHRQSVDI